jgi:polyferredoxin
MKSAVKLKTVRILSQVAFFGVFLFVFIRSLNPFWQGENPFLKYDLLIFLTHLTLQARYILPIAGILILSLLFGRYFCGWVCPLGSLIELLDFILKPIRRLNPFKKAVTGFESILIKTPPSWFLLGGVLITVFFAPPVIQFLHPNVWIIRIFSLSTLGIWYLAFLALLSMSSRRFWCTSICPLGALYGLIASASIFRLHIRKCSACGRCNICPMKAALYQTKTIILHQCILCADFEARCPVDGFEYNRIIGERDHVPDETRRLLLKQGGLIAGGVLAGTLFTFLNRSAISLADAHRFISGSANSVNTDLLRPPGVTAVSSETQFVQRCLRCFQCVRSCPNQIIKITGPGYGFDNLFTPSVEFGEFGCDYNCQVCQLVCPNYAIPLQTLEEKKVTKMGLAGIDENLCVVFTRDINCLVCEEVCPVPQKAIKIRDEQKSVKRDKILLRYPVLDNNLCIGCGICEARCPIAPKAITVSRI